MNSYINHEENRAFHGDDMTPDKTMKSEKSMYELMHTPMTNFTALRQQEHEERMIAELKDKVTSGKIKLTPPPPPESMRSAEEESYYVDRVTMECIKITGEQFCNEQNWPDVIATIMDAMDRCKPQDKKGDAAQCKRSAEDGWLPIDDYAKSGKPVYVKGGTYNSDREQYHGMKCDEPVLVRYKVQSNPDVDPPWVSVDNNSLAIKYPTHYWPCNPPSSQEGAG